MRNLCYMFLALALVLVVACDPGEPAKPAVKPESKTGAGSKFTSVPPIITPDFEGAGDDSGSSAPPVEGENADAGKKDDVDKADGGTEKSGDGAEKSDGDGDKSGV